MAETMNDIMHPGSDAADETFPYAPQGWSRSAAESVASGEGVSLTDDHWEAIKALQSYFSKHESAKPRELHDALDEKFHARGGIKFLYELFPGGPIAQGCRVAGLEPPAGSADASFGSVQ
jgi:TusE/DsrC/DsvC family sulfur relay protein